MSLPFKVRRLQHFSPEEIWPILSGYETREIYAVEKSETDARIVFDFRLIELEEPYMSQYYDDFNAEEIERYQNLLEQGYSFGAYQQEKLIGIALGEILREDSRVRVWEFHVMDEFRRLGVGRAMMEQVFAKARQDSVAVVFLETQNTNVKAIRFYRSMGFSLDSIDLSHYSNTNEIAFFMKHRL